MPLNNTTFDLITHARLAEFERRAAHRRMVRLAQQSAQPAAGAPGTLRHSLRAVTGNTVVRVGTWVAGGTTDTLAGRARSA